MLEDYVPPDLAAQFEDLSGERYRLGDDLGAVSVIYEYFYPPLEPPHNKGFNGTLASIEDSQNYPSSSAYTKAAPDTWSKDMQMVT